MVDFAQSGGTSSDSLGLFPREKGVSYTSEYVSGELVAKGDGENYGPDGSSLHTRVAYTPVRWPPTHSVRFREVDRDSSEVVQEAIVLPDGRLSGDAVTGAFNWVSGEVRGLRFRRAPLPGA